MVTAEEAAAAAAGIMGTVEEAEAAAVIMVTVEEAEAAAGTAAATAVVTVVGTAAAQWDLGGSMAWPQRACCCVRNETRRGYSCCHVVLMRTCDHNCASV